MAGAGGKRIDPSELKIRGIGPVASCADTWAAGVDSLLTAALLPIRSGVFARASNGGGTGIGGGDSGFNRITCTTELSLRGGFRIALRNPLSKPRCSNNGKINAMAYQRQYRGGGARSSSDSARLRMSSRHAATSSGAACASSPVCMVRELSQPQVNVRLTRNATRAMQGTAAAPLDQTARKEKARLRLKCAHRMALLDLRDQGRSQK